MALLKNVYTDKKIGKNSNISKYSLMGRSESLILLNQLYMTFTATSQRVFNDISTFLICFLKVCTVPWLASRPRARAGAYS